MAPLYRGDDRMRRAVLSAVRLIGRSIGRVYVSTSSTDAAVLLKAPVATTSAAFCNALSLATIASWRVLEPLVPAGRSHTEHANMTLGRTTALTRRECRDEALSLRLQRSLTNRR